MFAVNFSVNQDFQNGSPITIQDDSNYGDLPSTDKSQFTSRQIEITTTDTLTPTIYSWPYDNTNNSVKDLFMVDVDRDRAMVIKVTVTNPTAPDDSILFRESVVCLTQFIENCKLEKLDGLNLQNPKDRKRAMDLFITIIGEQSAMVEASRGDLVEAQKNLDFTINYCQCSC